MNFPVTESIAETFRVLTEGEWKDFFDDMRFEEFKRIRAVTEDKELTAIQVRVMLMDELEKFIQQARQVSKPVRSRK